MQAASFPSPHRSLLGFTASFLALALVYTVLTSSTGQVMAQGINSYRFHSFLFPLVRAINSTSLAQPLYNHSAWWKNLSFEEYSSTHIIYY